MDIIFVRSWRPLALRGIAGLLFGLVAFLWPSVTLTVLVLGFGVYALTDGVLAVAAGTRQRGREHAWMLVLEGLIGVAVGLAAIVWTGETALVLVYVVAFWAILTGALEILVAVRLRRELPGEVLLGVSGIGSVCLGALLFAWPRMGAMALVALLGCYALFFGTAMLLLALRLRQLTTQRGRFPRELHPRAA